MRTAKTPQGTLQNIQRHWLPNSDRLTLIGPFDLIAVSDGYSRSPTAKHNIEKTNAMPAREMLIGRIFGKRTVLLDLPSKNGVGYCLTQCRCGSKKILAAGQLLAGRGTQCRKCYGKDVKKRFTKHGHTKRGCNTRTYRTWAAMIQRCSNPKNAKWSDYGGRGIMVCEEWKDFNKFLSDMGERPNGKTLGRKDHDMGYSKSNCEWQTPLEQRKHQRPTVRFYAWCL